MSNCLSDSTCDRCAQGCKGSCDRCVTVKDSCDRCVVVKEAVKVCDCEGTCDSV